MFVISFYIKSSEKTFFTYLMVEKSKQTFFYEIKLRGKKKHVLTFAKYLLITKLFCNSPLHTDKYFGSFSNFSLLIYDMKLLHISG